MSPDRAAPVEESASKDDVQTPASGSDSGAPQPNSNADENREAGPSTVVARRTAEKSEPARSSGKRTPSRTRKAGSSTGFAPSDINDGRERYQWKSKYEPVANQQIDKEKWYLFILLYVIPGLMFLTWSDLLRLSLWFGAAKYALLARLAYAWLGGMLGGTLFDLKWLYHSVAKGMWHQDRALWRFFTPHISGALAFSVVLLISSNRLKIFDQTTFTSPTAVVAVSFLVGYFSDSAIAKLTEVAETLFGTTRKARDKLADEAKPEQSPPSKLPKN
jgi:hypothetical protein